MLIVIARSDDTTFGILHSRFHELWSLRMGTSLGRQRPRYTPTTTFETFPFPAGLTPRDTSPRPAGEGLGVREGAGMNPELAEAQASHPHPNPLPEGEGAKFEGSQAIAAAAKQLNALREAWLNPPEWVDWVRTPEEEQAGFPLRPVAKPRPLPNPPPPAGEGAKAEPTPTYEAELKKRTLTKLYNARPAWLAHAHRELDAAVAAAYGWTDYTPEMPDEEILKRLLALNLRQDRA